MKHVDEVITSKNSDTWIVTGKGPTFNSKIKEKGFPILSINESADMIGDPDLVLCNDWSVLSLFNKKHKAIAVPSMPHYFLNPSFELIHAILKNKDNIDVDSIYLFDLQTNKSKILFSDKPIIHAYMSTYESALWLLGFCGVKNIITTGIDYGKGYHSSFHNNNDKTDYSWMKYYVAPIIDFFNLKIESYEWS